MFRDLHDVLAVVYEHLFRRYARRSGQVACIRHHDERLFRRPCPACKAAL